MLKNKFDLIIVGGGIMGSASAYQLLKDGYTGRIGIFEKDKIYEFSSTPRSEGGFRLSFSQEINIRLCKYSIEVYKSFEEKMQIGDERPHINFSQNGYLYLTTPELMPRFIKNSQIQNDLGANVQIQSIDETLKMIPELNVNDLAGSVFDSDAGSLDAYSVLQAYVKQSKRLGAEYVYQPVKEILAENQQIKGIRLENGEEYHAPVVINAAGAWSGVLSNTIGIDIPVKPYRYQVFSIDLAKKFQNKLPQIVVDPKGIYFRNEGEKITTGIPHRNPDGFDFRSETSIFEEIIWPVLYERSSVFEQVKLERGWIGLYDYNYIDQNAIIGGHPEMKGYYMITGFSGHGVMQAPAAANGLSELIRLGKYETIALGKLSIERFAKNELMLETAVI